MCEPEIDNPIEERHGSSPSIDWDWDEENWDGNDGGTMDGLPTGGIGG